MRRYVVLGSALALASGMFAALVMLPSCYRVPTPDCGFRCGPAGECPADYACSSLDDRCHLIGSDPSLVCGPIDVVPDAGDASAASDATDATDATDAADAGDAADAADAADAMLPD